ncbi:hypothetical protein T10_11682 [Trichinella papuae]|uniref:Uncharacterized protein n=1 Tax=Trichinella papuae TaxID=268474 RepID=A0A0V1N7G0_9BILA|nr:hypothetical protein T10_11682 [Trichinella papuae]
MKKKAIVKKRSFGETTPIPTVYNEEASAASTDPSSSGSSRFSSAYGLQCTKTEQNAAPDPKQRLC